MSLLSSRKWQFSGISLQEEARRRVLTGAAESFLFIVPNRIAQRYLRKRFVRAAAGRSIPELNILTLADLASELAKAALPTYRQISDAESAVLIELSIRDLLNIRELKFFERAANDESARSRDSSHAFPIPRGTFELVVNTIRQLKESGVSPQDVAHDVAKTKAAKGETTDVRRAGDILKIYEAYQSRLIARDLMDTYGQVLLVNERYSVSPPFASQDFTAAFPYVTDVFVSGFFYLEQPSVTMIASLAKVEAITWWIELEEPCNNPDLFSGLFELETRLLKSGFQKIERPTIRYDEGHKGKEIQEHLGNHLFRFEEEEITKRPIPEIKCAVSSDTLQEVEDIARRIKLIYEADTSIEEEFSRVVIGTPNVEAYTPLIQEVFRRHEIPVEIADRSHLDRAPLVLALLALMEMARVGLRKQELTRVLRSPYLTFDHDDGEPLDSENLLRILLTYKPSGDARAWEKSLKAQLGRIESKKEESEDPIEFDRLRVEEERIHRSLRDLKRIQAILRPLRQEMKPAEFVDAFKKLLQELRVEERLLDKSAISIAASTLDLDTRAYRALLDLLDELQSLFRFMGNEEEKRPLEYYEQRLKPALIIERFDTRSAPNAVLVTSLAQSISQPADYLFLAGLVEGAFPSPYQPQVFLTESLQRGEQKQRLEERVLFYQAITNFRKELYLSYPRRASGGPEINRSSFINALEEVAILESASRPNGIFSYADLFREGIEVELPQSETVTAESYFATLREFVPLASKAVKERENISDTVFRGLVDPSLLTDDEREVLEYNRTRVWSVTQLELYAKCPFRYFAQEVLALDEEREAEEGLDARDRGSLLHEVLREFLVSRRERKLQPLQDISEAELPAAYSEARSIAEKKFIERESDHPFWRLDRDRLLAEDQPGGNVINRFIQRERELAPYEPRPTFFEVSFGGSGRAPSGQTDSQLSRDEPVELGGIKLRGKIDRIDITDPERGEENVYTVIDYKSGKRSASFSEIERGLSFQLPLYLKVAEDLLRSHLPELKGVAALYHKLLDPESKRELGLALREYSERAFEQLGGKRKRGLFDTEEELAQLIDETVKKAKSYVDGISAGRFPLTTADLRKECATCPYSAVCRVREAEEAGVLR